MKRRYYFLFSSVCFSMLLFGVIQAVYWYFTHTNSYGEFKGFVHGLGWGIKLAEIGLTILLILPLFGIIWGKRKKDKELVLGSVYAEIYGALLMIGVILNAYT